MKCIRAISAILLFSCVWGCNTSISTSSNTVEEKKEEAPDKFSEIYNKLNGEWEWIYSQGGIAQVYQTPQSTGSTQKLTFTARHILSIERDAKAVNTEYTIVAEHYAGEEYLSLKFKEEGLAYHDNVLRLPSNDTLLLVAPPYYADGMAHAFVRKRGNQ